MSVNLGFSVPEVLLCLAMCVRVCGGEGRLHVLFSILISPVACVEASISNGECIKVYNYIVFMRCVWAIWCGIPRGFLQNVSHLILTICNVSKSGFSCSGGSTMFGNVCVWVGEAPRFILYINITSCLCGSIVFQW